MQFSDLRSRVCGRILRSLLLVALSGSMHAQETATTTVKPVKVAIIKADDLRSVQGEAGKKWERFLSISRERGVKVSIGIICNSLTGGDSGYFDWIRQNAARGDVEFWQHGWDHKKWKDGERELWEFSGSGYAHQKDHFDKAQAVFKEKTGLVFHSFGAPFNQIDGDTGTVLAETREIETVFINGKQEVRGKVGLLMALRGESDGTGKPNGQRFIEDYAKRPHLTFMAIQFHPPYFSEEGFAAYAAILDFLKAEGWTFMLPAEYARRVDATP